MTFAEFQATRTPCRNLRDKFQDDRFTPSATGHVYLDALHIEDVSPALHWNDEACRRGRFHLLIGREE